MAIDLNDKPINYGGLSHFYDELKLNDLNTKVDKIAGTILVNFDMQLDYTGINNITETGVYTLDVSMMEMATMGIAQMEVTNMPDFSGGVIQNIIINMQGATPILVVRQYLNNVWTEIVSTNLENLTDNVFSGYIYDGDNSTIKSRFANILTYSAPKIDTLLSSKQNTLIPDNNISLQNNVINAVGYEYNATNASITLNGVYYDLQTAKVASFSQNDLTVTLDSSAGFGTVDYFAAKNGGEYAKVVAVNGLTLTLEHWINNINVGDSTYIVSVNVATNMFAVAEGCATNAKGIGSHSEGGYTLANKNFTHAEGYKTVADYAYAHAEGQQTTASGRYGAHSEGRQTQALGYSSHAEGSNNTASGNYSHAEGYQTIASSDYAHTEGYQTNATTTGTHAEGVGTVANNWAQHSQGIYNLSHQDSNYLNVLHSAANTVFSIGDGTAANDRKNAFEIMQNGDIYAVGVGGYNGTDTKIQDANIKTLQEVVNSTSTALSDALYIVAVGALSIRLNDSFSGKSALYIEYSFDGVTWTQMQSTGSPVTVSNGNKLYLRGIVTDINSVVTNSDTNGWFNTPSGSFKAYGDIRYLHDYRNIEKPIQEKGFFNVFRNVNIIKAPYFGGDAIGLNAFNNAFRSVTLEEALEFKKPIYGTYKNPNNNLYSCSLNNLYRGCTALTKTYPIEVMGWVTIEGLYRGCTALVKAEPIYITKADNGTNATSFQNTFNGCTDLQEATIICRYDADYSVTNNFTDVPTTCHVYISDTMNAEKWVPSGITPIVLPNVLHNTNSWVDRLVEKYLAGA